MKFIYYGEGDLAWIEPETPEDDLLLAQARREQWTLPQIISARAQPRSVEQAT